MPHSFAIRVYYEDTDLAGIVYYANYLKYIERARSEWIRALGIDQARLKAEAGTVFAVRRLVADYVAPARFDDLVTVTSSLAQIRPSRLILSQEVHRDTALLFSAEVTLVALSQTGRPTRLPALLRSAFQAD